ncbi:MAG: ABC transporter substrate-binding protein [Candidatus Hodarchaeales archaeon]|jgi:peptide/nickel transport system substrate-binding protein
MKHPHLKIIFSLSIVFLLIFFFGWASIPVASEEPVVNPGTFTYETFATLNVIDPATNYDSFGNGINEQICETLVDFSGDSTNLIGLLATSWTISNDGLQYNFTLRHGVTFHDGTPLNAYVMKYSIDRVHILNDPSGPSSLTAGYIKGGSALLALSDVDVSDAITYLEAGGVIAIDEFTLQINLEKAFSPFLSILRYRSMCAVSPAFIINNKPLSYSTNINDNIQGMVPLTDMLPGLTDWTKLGLDSGHESAISGVVPGGIPNTPAEHTYYATHGTGTGPYKLNSVTVNEVKIEKNINWWNAAAFHADAPDTVIWKTVSVSTTRYLDLQSGSADSADLTTSDRLQILENNVGIINKPYTVIDPTKFQVHQVNKFSNTAAFFNLDDTLPPVAGVESPDSIYNASELEKYAFGTEKASPDNPFTSLLFRKAFALSMDYDAVINTAYAGLASRMEGAIPNGMFGHDDQLIEEGLIPEFSPIDAKNLFEQVGWKGALYIAFNSGNTIRKTISLLLKSTIEAFDVGIYINVVEYIWPTYLDQINNGLLALYIFGWSASYPDPHDFVHPYFHSTNGHFAPLNKYFNPTVNSLIDQASNDCEPSERAQLYSWIERNASADIPLIYLTQSDTPLITKPWIKSIESSGSLNPFRDDLVYSKIGKPATWTPPPVTTTTSTSAIISAQKIASVASPEISPSQTCLTDPGTNVSSTSPSTSSTTPSSSLVIPLTSSSTSSNLTIETTPSFEILPLAVTLILVATLLNNRRRKN